MKKNPQGTIKEAFETGSDVRRGDNFSLLTGGSSWGCEEMD